MPKYTYRCTECEEFFEIIHTMDEEINICECGVKETLVRVPSLPLTFIPKSEKGGAKKIGSVVNESIRDAKQALKDQKAEAKREFE